MNSLENIVSLCKRRGFIYPSSEIYGGLASCFDYGPLGTELKKNLEQKWRNFMTREHDNIFSFDSSIIMHKDVWKASGHLDNFSDLLVDCKKCKTRFREDQIDVTKPCPVCKAQDFTSPKSFNLMFKTQLGSVEDEKNIIYLRPETAQGIYVNFKNILNSTRVNLPFGIAQVGKAFRNEIITKNFIFRTYEFEQMEMQYFVEPDGADKAFEYWKESRMRFYKDLAIKDENLRYKDHGEHLAHYAKAAFDIEFNFPFGFQELEGIHNRGNFDLSRHEEFSNKDMRFTRDDGSKIIPYIVETSAGLNRMMLAVLCDSYEEEEVNSEKRIVLKMHPSISPYKVAVLPLVKKDGLLEKSEKIYKDIKEEYYSYFDANGAIGKRYRRQDEIGTPFCVTIDYDSMQDNKVTIRNRDDMTQVRVGFEKICEFIKENIKKYKR